MKTKVSLTQIRNKPIPDLIPISTIASQLLDDIQLIYGTKYASSDTVQSYSQSAVSETNLIGPKSSELIVIATRSKQLREELLLRLAYRTAIANKKYVAVYSVNESCIQFTRKLVGAMSNIPADVDIYQEKLSEAEYRRLTSELVKLTDDKIHMYPIQPILRGWLCNSTNKLMKCTCDIGLVLVDGVQYLTDEHCQYLGADCNLGWLKGLAEVLQIPVVAIYHLDSDIEDHPSTLTRAELVEVEKLSTLTDGFVLMSGTREKLVFELPKIPNAKTVEWLDQIRDFSWDNRK